MKRAVVIGCLLAGCTHSRPTIAPENGRAAVLELAVAVRAAAEQCSANAAYLARLDDGRAQRLADACVAALIPARDAVAFGAADVDPWTRGSSEVVGCMALTTRDALEHVREAFIAAGFPELPAMMRDGLAVSHRLASAAPDWCDPRHPTARTSVFIDPRIAPVSP